MEEALFDVPAVILVEPRVVERNADVRECCKVLVDWAPRATSAHRFRPRKVCRVRALSVLLRENLGSLRASFARVDKDEHAAIVLHERYRHELG